MALQHILYGTDAESQFHWDGVTSRFRFGNIGGYTPYDVMFENIWYRVYLSYNPNLIRYFVNGVQVYQNGATYTDRLHLNPNGFLQFFTHMRASTASLLHQFIDVAEISMWNRALTPADVLEVDSEYNQ